MICNSKSQIDEILLIHQCAPKCHRDTRPGSRTDMKLWRTVLWPLQARLWNKLAFAIDVRRKRRPLQPRPLRLAWSERPPSAKTARTHARDLVRAATGADSQQLTDGSYSNMIVLDETSGKCRAWVSNWLGSAGRLLKFASSVNLAVAQNYQYKILVEYSPVAEAILPFS